MLSKALSLYQLNEKIKYGLEGLFPFPMWIVAEISEMNGTQHCYLELVERENISDTVIAKARAMIWSQTYSLLKPYFQTTTGYELAAGLKVLVKVEVQFSELYGLSLSIKDIDPNYTIGDLQQRRQIILKRLEEEGVLEMNKGLSFPELPKRIAIISSPQAAGYQDFVKQLSQSDYSYYTKLFPALMQGTQAVPTIMQALERIYAHEKTFDVVVIIRGGGAVSDLSCFDNYELAAHVAQFPLPILTGIGHDKDKTSIDEVAYRSLKTPTAVAAFLITCLQNCKQAIWETSELFSALVKSRLAEQNRALSLHSNFFKYMLPAFFKKSQQELIVVAKDLNYLTVEKLSVGRSQQEKLQKEIASVLSQQYEKAFEKITCLKQQLQQQTAQLFIKKQQILRQKNQVLDLLSPQKLLARGYSITTCNGKVVKDATQLCPGDKIQTQLAKGKLHSIVKESKQKS